MNSRTRGTLDVRDLLGNLLWPLLALAAILVFNAFFTPVMFKIEVKDGHLFGSLIDILNRATPVMLMGIGMTLVIATGGIDISVGSVSAVSGSFTTVLLVVYGMPLAWAIVIGLAVTVALGFWNGFMVANIGVQPIVATLIMWVLARGIATLFANGQTILFENAQYEYIANGFLFGLPFPITILAVVFVVVQLLTRRTALGLFIESVGCNPVASRYSGVNVRMIKQTVYVFTGLCAGIAGLINTANIKVADVTRSGDGLELDAILAVVIGGTSLDGGTFSLTGTIIGAIVMQTLTTTILTNGVPVQVTRVIKALVVVLIILIQSETFRMRVRSLFGRKAHEAANR
ncbi:MAG TPA: ABC transporter permease [Rectinemataceae bacterium]|nr:ABC transporter permease [Rectinemataceae bacterium]